LFGKSKKKTIGDLCVSSDSGNGELSRTDVFHTQPLYQKIEHRWGVRTAEITDYMIKSNGESYPVSVAGGDTVEIKFRCVFYQNIKSPIFGILLKTPDGINLYGASSRELMDDQIGLIMAGAALDFTFKLKLNFNTGPILLSVGLTHCDEYGNDEPLDRRYDSILINVDNEKSFIGLVDAETECVIEVIE